MGSLLQGEGKHSAGDSCAVTTYALGTQLKKHSSFLLSICERGNLVVKVTDSWPMYHVFEPSTAEDSQCKGGRYTLNMSISKHPPVGVVWKIREELPAQVSSSSRDHGSK
ncbi:hypothetical protein TNCV_1747431 [Trichonephila clavipes]|nr:hypothetical protein TNCV_1747431 [Trichonephila clavipes]